MFLFATHPPCPRLLKRLFCFQIGKFHWDSHCYLTALSELYICMLPKCLRHCRYWIFRFQFIFQNFPFKFWNIDSGLLGCDVLSLSEYLPTFWRKFFTKLRDLLVQRHNVTSQKTWIFINTSLRTSSRILELTSYLTAVKPFKQSRHTYYLFSSKSYVFHPQNVCAAVWLVWFSQ